VRCKKTVRGSVRRVLIRFRDDLLGRLVAQALAEARVPLSEDAIAARFQGRGPWKKRLPQILDTLIAIGRVRPVEGGKSYVLQ